MKRRSVYISVGLGILLSTIMCACSRSTNPVDQSPGPSTFFPFTVGSWWIYEVVDRPTIMSDSISNQLILTVVSKQYLTNGNPVSRVTVSCPDSIVRTYLFGGDSTFFMSQSADSLMIYASLQDTSPRLYLRLPLEVGKSWQTSTGAFSVVDSVDSTGDVTVPAGRYTTCFQVRTSGGWWQAPITKLCWYKELTGLLKVDYSQVGLINIHFNIKLLSYHITSSR